MQPWVKPKALDEGRGVCRVKESDRLLAPTSNSIEPEALCARRRVGNKGGWMGWRREREECGVLKLMKQKIKRKKYAVFYFSGKRKIFIYYL